MGTWIDIANTEKRIEVFGEKKTIEELVKMVPGGVITWQCPGAVNPEDSSVLDLIIPCAFAVVEHRSHQ